MFSSKSPIVKIVGYVIMGFFSLIIIISFGMPDFISRMGLDQSVMATVNGEKVSRIDYLRFRDSRFGQNQDAKMEDMILNYYISEVLLLQEARKAGFVVSDERVKEDIRRIPGLRDEKGNYSADRLKGLLQHNRMSLGELMRLIETNMVREDYMRAIRMGIAVPAEEARKEAIFRDSRVQVRYAYASTLDLKKKYAAAIAVTDDEVSAELKKNPAEIKDPKTDRKRIHDKLEDQKLQKARKELIDKIDAIALKGGSFDEAAALLGGVVATTEPFKIGEMPRDPGAAGRNLADLTNAKVFLEECLTLKPQATSRAIITASGIYLFTPTVKDIKEPQNLEKEGPQLMAQLENELLRNVMNNAMQKIQEKSRIIKNPRPREAE